MRGTQISNRTAAPSGAVRRFAGAAAGLLLALHGAAAAQSCPADLPWTPLGLERARLHAARDAAAGGDGAVAAAVSALLARAEAALAAPLRSVMDKPRAGDSGDKHDYVSLAPYWWPDPTKKDGRPYVQQDGETNPERNSGAFDRVRMREMTEDVIDLALVHALTGDDRYAEKADAALRTWFLAPETRMNPTLAYAQQIPGRTNGRAIGIIDTHRMPELIDAALLLAGADALSEETLSGLRQWIGAYAAWLISSEFGQEERAAKNNHGTHYDAQLASYLVFAGRCDLAGRVLEDAKVRLDKQIDAAGVMPEEARRTRSLHYHAFNAEAFLRLALIADALGDDLYGYEAEPGAGSLEDTVHMLAGYAGRTSTWPYRRLDDRGAKSLWRLLLRTRLLREDPMVERALARMEGWPDDRLTLIAYE